MFGATLFAPIARAAGFLPAVVEPPITDGPPTSAIFSAEQRALVSALSERVIPTTDTPGAIAAGVPDYIEKLLADWSAPSDRVPIIEGLLAIDAVSVQQYGLPAIKATAEQQDALLTRAMNNEFEGGASFFILFRQLVVTGYYTSEIGMTQEREYLPVPGEYNGEFLYSQVNKVYSS
jgi:gluconate 2-dehydrogenase gamma chain